MPNRFTEVPEGQVPQLPRAGRALVPLADAFMILMVSRPATGSLRTTWVTPATLWLSVVTVVLALPVSVLAVRTGMQQDRHLLDIAGVAGLIVSLGSAAVAIVGGLQRRLNG